LSFKNKFPYIFIIDESSDFTFARGAPQNLEVPLQYFYTMAEASDFKFGTEHGIAKGHHKVTPIGRSGCGLGLGELPQILFFK